MKAGKKAKTAVVPKPKTMSTIKKKKASLADAVETKNPKKVKLLKQQEEQHAEIELPTKTKKPKKDKLLKQQEEEDQSEIEPPTKTKKSKKVKLVKQQEEEEEEQQSEIELPVTKKVSAKKTKEAAINGSTKVKKNKDKKDDKTATKSKKTKKSHMEELEGLKDIDPEFYKFLKQNDKKLLEFNLLGSDSEDDEEENGEQEEKNEKSAKKRQSADDDEEGDDAENDAKFHKPSSGDLEVASDESDFEADDDEDETMTTDGSQKITLNLLRQWQLQLEKPNVPIDIVRKVIQGFNSALASISGEEDKAAAVAYKVVGGAAFNGVVQLCVLHLQPAILRLLGLKPGSTTPLHKTKKWVKVRGCLRYYLTDLIRLIEQISSANVLSVLLKHLHQMSSMVASFSTLGKTILKRLIVLWATGDETVRVLAFLCILKITRNQQVSMLHHVLKAMYLSYVRNSKFVSPNTLPGINFMRRSLVEMFALDLNASYQHAFLYIRQLAIHLRNAVILKKKDSFQSVYNWQYVNSLRLWADLLGATANKPQLQPLIYPLVTIATGVIRLIPTAQYFPLRFHCVQSLIALAKETHTFVPVLPFVLEVLRSNTFQRKHSGVSMRPLQFTCILRLNKAQLAENGFRDEVVEQVCSLTLEYLTHESASLAFSDLIVPAVGALKAYLKECRNSNHSRKIKQLLDKVQENARFIDQERRKITFGLKDLALVQAWETQVRSKGTPLAIYYAAWVKTHETKKRRQAAQSDSINEYNLPMIKRNAGAKSGGVPVKNENGEVELFPSDSEGDDNDLPDLPVGAEFDDDDEEEAVVPTKKAKKQKKSTESVADVSVDIPVEDPDVDGNVDIVKDLDLDDW